MKIYNLKRGQGKTTRLIVLSEFNKVPILCIDAQHRKIIKDMANRLGAKIPEPITISELPNLRGAITRTDYLIDEAPQFLARLIANSTGGTLIAPMAITLSEES